jgi:hypothetical protein
MKKIHLLTITAALFLVLTQISCNGGGTDSSNTFGTQGTQVGAATDGGDTDAQSKSFQESTTQEGPFGFGILYKTIAATWEGDHDLPVYMDLGLNPTAVPDSFADILQVSPDDYILYPQSNDESRFVQYSYTEGSENDELIGDFVDGKLTPDEALSNFQDGQIVIVYFGGTYNNETYASVTIDFDTSTWSGVFLGEYDVAVSGSIAGQFFYSETITEFNNPDVPVSGMITGSFYGPGADDIAGLIDITRNGLRLTDLFDAQKVDINAPAP